MLLVGLVGEDGEWRALQRVEEALRERGSGLVVLVMGFIEALAQQVADAEPQGRIGQEAAFGQTHRERRQGEIHGVTWEG